MNPVRNFSRGLNPAAEQRGIISNGVNLSAEFNATTGFTLLVVCDQAYTLYRPRNQKSTALKVWSYGLVGSSSKKP